MILRGVLLGTVACFASVCAIAVEAVAPPDKPSSAPLLDEYFSLRGGERADASGYIGYLKSKPEFKELLANLPPFAIILYDNHVPDLLKTLGYGADQYKKFDTGSSTTNVIYDVAAKEGAPRFLVNVGQPGAGGVTTQAAELAALGCRYIVHVGQCGAVSKDIADDAIVVANASYKDGAAVLLSAGDAGKVDPLAWPDKVFSELLVARLSEAKENVVRGTGYTVPIYYMQPEALRKELVRTDSKFGAMKVGFIEMEQAPFFAICAHLGVKAASVVVVSDRILLGADGKLTQTFSDSSVVADGLRDSVRACVGVFDGLMR
jgi:purine-nucleoside phosphorylase